MRREELKKIKEGSEAKILEILNQFTVKTGLYLKEISLLEAPRMGQLYSEVVRVEIKTALPEEVPSRRGITTEGIEKKEQKLKVQGFYDFTVVRDHPGYIDVRYKGESIRGIVGANVRLFPQDEGYAILKLEIMENVPLITTKKEGLLENEQKITNNRIR